MPLSAHTRSLATLSHESAPVAEQLAPPATHAISAWTRAHRSLSAGRQLTQLPSGAPQPPTTEENASFRYGGAHRDDGTRRRERHHAALSTAREAQSMRFIAGGKQPSESSSLIMRVPPLVKRLALAPHHDGATAESRDAERGSPFPRPSGWTAARVRRRKRDVKRCFWAHAAHHRYRACEAGA